MVTFVTSLIGAAAIFARVTSAVPMEYGGEASYVYSYERPVGDQLNIPWL